MLNDKLFENLITIRDSMYEAKKMDEKIESGIFDSIGVLLVENKFDIHLLSSKYEDEKRFIARSEDKNEAVEAARKLASVFGFKFKGLMEGVAPEDEDSEEKKIQKLTEQDEDPEDVIHDEESFPEPEPEEEEEKPEEKKPETSEPKAPEITKEYLGNTEDNHYYFISTQDTEGNVEDLQIVDQEGVEKFSAKKNSIDVNNIGEFLFKGIKELRIESIEFGIFERYLFPFVYPEQQKEVEEESDIEKELEEQPEEEKPVENKNESKIVEGVHELVGEVPGIDKKDQEILNWAIENKVISNEWPSDEDMIDKLSAAEDRGEIVGVDEQNMEDIKSFYLKYILLPQAKQEHERQDVDITSGEQLYLVTFDDGDKVAMGAISLDRAWKEAEVDYPDKTVAGVKLLKEEDEDLENLLGENVREDVKRVEPGEYVVTFFDGGNVKIGADSKVDAMKKAREQYPEKRVSNVVLHKQTKPGKDVAFENSCQDINIYKTVSGSKTGLKEEDLEKNEDGKLVDKESREPVILDQELSGSAVAKESKNNLIEMKITDHENHVFNVFLVNDNSTDTVIDINGKEFRFDAEFASYWRDEEGKLSEEGLEQLALDALSNMESEDYNELVTQATEQQTEEEHPESKKGTEYESKVNEKLSTEEVKSLFKNIDPAFAKHLANMNVSKEEVRKIGVESGLELSKENVKEDQIPGGLADKNKPEDFNPEQINMGIKVEMEHTDDPEKAREIAMDHLREDPEYYTHLKKMEMDNAPKKVESILTEHAGSIDFAKDIVGVARPEYMFGKGLQALKHRIQVALTSREWDPDALELLKTKLAEVDAQIVKKGTKESKVVDDRQTSLTESLLNLLGSKTIQPFDVVKDSEEEIL